MQLDPAHAHAAQTSASASPHQRHIVVQASPAGSVTARQLLPRRDLGPPAAPHGRADLRCAWQVLWQACLGVCWLETNKRNLAHRWQPLGLSGQ